MSDVERMFEIGDHILKSSNTYIVRDGNYFKFYRNNV